MLAGRSPIKTRLWVVTLRLGEESARQMIWSCVAEGPNIHLYLETWLWVIDGSGVLDNRCTLFTRLQCHLNKSRQ